MKTQVAAAPIAPSQPPAPPAPAAGPVVTVGPGGAVIAGAPGTSSPAAIYQAAKAQREELSELMGRLRNRRDNIAGKLQDGRVSGANRTGLEKQLEAVDARIIEMEGMIQQADKELVTAAGRPGATIPPRSGEGGGRGPDVPQATFIVVPALLVLFVLFPLALAWSRRLWKRAGTAVSTIPGALMDRFSRLEQNVDAMAIEIERISEGQRFMTKLFAEGGAKVVGQGAAQPVEVGVRERAAQD